MWETPSLSIHPVNKLPGTGRNWQKTKCSPNTKEGVVIYLGPLVQEADHFWRVQPRRIWGSPKCLHWPSSCLPCSSLVLELASPRTGCWHLAWSDPNSPLSSSPAPQPQLLLSGRKGVKLFGAGNWAGWPARLVSRDFPIMGADLLAAPAVSFPVAPGRFCKRVS